MNVPSPLKQLNDTQVKILADLFLENAQSNLEYFRGEVQRLQHELWEMWSSFLPGKGNDPMYMAFNTQDIEASEIRFTQVYLEILRRIIQGKGALPEALRNDFLWAPFPSYPWKAIAPPGLSQGLKDSWGDEVGERVRDLLDLLNGYRTLFEAAGVLEEVRRAMVRVQDAYVEREIQGAPDVGEKHEN